MEFYLYLHPAGPSRDCLSKQQKRVVQAWLDGTLALGLAVASSCELSSVGLRADVSAKHLLRVLSVPDLLVEQTNRECRSSILFIVTTPQKSPSLEALLLRFSRASFAHVVELDEMCVAIHHPFTGAVQSSSGFSAIPDLELQMYEEFAACSRARGRKALVCAGDTSVAAYTTEIVGADATIVQETDIQSLLACAFYVEADLGFVPDDPEQRRRRACLPYRTLQAFACGCVVVLPGLAEYSADLNCRLLPHVHYVPLQIDRDRGKTNSDLCSMSSDEMLSIAQEGRNYVMQNCNPAAAVTRFLHSAVVAAQRVRGTAAVCRGACSLRHFGPDTPNTKVSRQTDVGSDACTREGRSDVTTGSLRCANPAEGLKRIAVLQREWASFPTVCGANEGVIQHRAGCAWKINSARDEQYWYGFVMFALAPPSAIANGGSVSAEAPSQLDLTRPLAVYDDSLGRVVNIHVWNHVNHVPLLSGYEPIEVWTNSKAHDCSAGISADGPQMWTHEWKDEYTRDGYRGWNNSVRFYALQLDAGHDLCEYRITTTERDTCFRLHARAHHEGDEHANEKQLCDRKEATTRGALRFWAVPQRKRNTHFVVFKRCNMPLYIWDTFEDAFAVIAGDNDSDGGTMDGLDVRKIFVSRNEASGHEYVAFDTECGVPEGNGRVSNGYVLVAVR